MLRPGGTLVGYDLLGTAPARILHRLEGAPHRFVDRGQLRPHLAGLPLREVTVRENAALTRFRATRTAGR